MARKTTVLKELLWIGQTTILLEGLLKIMFTVPLRIIKHNNIW